MSWKDFLTYKLIPTLGDISTRRKEMMFWVCGKVFLFSLVCGGKISDGKDHIEDNIADIKSMVKSIKSLVQWWVTLGLTFWP